MFGYVRALEATACSTAHGFQSRRPRSLLTALNYCRIGLICVTRVAVVYSGSLNHTYRLLQTRYKDEVQELTRTAPTAEAGDS